MSDVEKPEDWTDEQFAAYLGEADDPMDDTPVIESVDTVDVPEIDDEGEPE